VIWAHWCWSSYKDWSQSIQCDEELCGPAEMTRLLQDALRLLGISCGDCHTLGSCNMFCKDPKCLSHTRRSNKSIATPEPGTKKEHFQEAKNAAARAELKIASNAAVPWVGVTAEWQEKFMAEYATK